MLISNEDIDALWLTLKLSSITTGILLVLCIPIACWLTFSTSKLKPLIATLTTLPLILPPSVIGFYLLLILNPNSTIGQLINHFGFKPLPFSFNGLVLTSIIYSLPFVLQPIYNNFNLLGEHTFEVAATIGAGKYDTFFNLFLPQARAGILSGIILGFTHTVGEFGMILMIGGNIPKQTQVASLQIYNHVEAFEYHQANTLTLILLGFSFIILFTMYLIQHKFNYLNNTQ